LPEDRARHTALHELHAELGARFTEFGGWDMPVRYGSIIDEHRAVRESAGIFDLSHMGELRVSGPGAGEGLSAALVNDPRRLRVGRAGYSLLCQADGGVIDDLIVYRLEHTRYLVVPNASNRETVATELQARLAGYDAELADETLETSLVALQGPAAAGIVAGLTNHPLQEVRNYTAAEATVAGLPVLLARTGYTGEDGFELFCAWDDGPALWTALTAAAPDSVRPCGLGARDTLRTEAGMPLYGNELDRETTPIEAGLAWAVQLDRDFIGRDALVANAVAPRKQLVGLVLRARGIARHGYPVAATGESEPIGVVTSGVQSPTLAEAIAMAYVRPEVTAAGTMLDVIIREAAVPAEVVPLPFYRRPGP